MLNLHWFDLLCICYITIQRVEQVLQPIFNKSIIHGVRALKYEEKSIGHWQFAGHIQGVCCIVREDVNNEMVTAAAAACGSPGCCGDVENTGPENIGTK